MGDHPLIGRAPSRVVNVSHSAGVGRHSLPESDKIDSHEASLHPHFAVSERPHAILMKFNATIQHPSTHLRRPAFRKQAAQDLSGQLSVLLAKAGKDGAVRAP